MVCYNGAGIQMDGMSKEQADAYLKAANIEEIFTDVTAIAASDLEAFQIYMCLLNCWRGNNVFQKVKLMT